MASSDVLTLNRPMGARFVQILYWIALVLIALGVLWGIVGGVRTMTRQAPPSAAMSAPPAMGMAAPPAMGAPDTMIRPDGMRRGMPRFGHRGMMMRGPMMGGRMMRNMSPPARGGLRIIFALFRGIIVLMVVRVLAEIATSILAMGAKARF